MSRAHRSPSGRVVPHRAAIVLASLLLAAAPARAHHSDQESFDVCRSVALLHLNAAEWETAVIGEDTTRSLLEQIGFVMVESVFSRPPDDMKDLNTRLLFTEAYFFGQGQKMAEAQRQYPTVAARDKLLATCVGFIWFSVKREIDELMKWRREGMGAPKRGYWPPAVDPDRE